MPFGRPLIVIASTRYEIGRHDATRWKAWTANLRRIAADPRNTVAANNLYDAKYLEYFTGLKNVPVLENLCSRGPARNTTSTRVEDATRLERFHAAPTRVEDVGIETARLHQVGRSSLGTRP